jgi:hypothetical protein
MAARMVGHIAAPAPTKIGTTAKAPPNELSVVAITAIF